MTLHLLRFTLACGLACAVALAATGVADAKSKRAAYKKPRPPIFVYRSLAREPGCHVTYDSSGFAQRPDLNPACEAAFRRIYPPRR
jgi:hypothetical protein